MQLVIPMSGFGERFRRAGYAVPKPLIEVEGRPIVEHVLDLFPGVTDVVFICNEDHLADPAFGMRELLRGLRPTAQVVGIPAHKLGPVHAVLQVRDLIRPDQPVVVNYCDFTALWDFAAFEQWTADTQPDGAVVAYRGFHPHSYGSTFYAYVREQDGVVSAIQEKQPYTDTPSEEFASSGTYWFRTGALMLDAFERTMAQSLDVNGEYYVSLTYRPLLTDGRRVTVYPIDHFMQWGTPGDLADYLTWSDAFRVLADPASGRARTGGTTVVPAAGAGSRFADAGTTTPKPAIGVSGRPMLEQVLGALPESDRVVVVTRPEVAEALAAAGSTRETMLLPEVTDGQARTVALALDRLALQGPVTVASSDGGLPHDPAAFQALWAPESGEGAPDLVVWVAEDYRPAAAKPESYGWVTYDDAGDVTGLRVKAALEPAAGERLGVITGTFSWRDADGYRAAFSRLVERDGRVRGELYVDSLIEDAQALGMRVAAFPARAWLSWGTPYELRSFQYWQEGLSRWARHPYSTAKDPMVPAAARLLSPVQAELVPVPPPLLPGPAQ